MEKQIQKPKQSTAKKLIIDETIKQLFLLNSINCFIKRT